MSKHILLIVTGGIAAYKMCDVCSKLSKLDYEVKVVMTKHASEFVGKASFEALTHNKVHVDEFSSSEYEIPHISLAEWADLVVVAPATANILAKMRSGLGDDLASTILLATTAPVFIAPAMNVHMLEHPATQENIEVLKERGIQVIESEFGHLACGYLGKGKLASVEKIVNTIDNFLSQIITTATKDLEGVSILITAGPTYEKIDPVRFIGNRSSGKMGLALARAALLRGARVDLVLGPVSVSMPEHENLTILPVESGLDMLQACLSHFDHADICIGAAAVSDLRPAKTAKQKLKKGKDDMSNLSLVENPDIIATLAREKHKGQYMVGFAAETDHVKEYAQKKRVSKFLDMIVANKVGGSKEVFGADKNTASIITDKGVTDLPELSKDELAHKILDAICLERC
ncbi:MAG: bifunctional phosphopantothenoylcysteine decarboxylase/phosphopantothenate--cysteine ligase CoaBC [Corynebacterium sp.]|nr:bifunctional phosphopantothenoylcysteine decarboxylase/phosphopantothenate--cysteine ligase CoaBC [Corynebacterium sp.]